MQRSIRVRWGNLKVGILLVFAFGVLFWASLTGTGTSIFDPKGLFTCYFNNVNGLLPGAPVWLSGVEVGNVKSIEFVNLDSLRQVKVTCRVSKSVWHQLTPGSQVQLGVIGFLGDKFVEIIPGLRGGDPIAEGDVIPTRESGSAERMFKEGELAMKEAGDIMSNLDDILARMNKGEGTLGKFSTDDAAYVLMTKLLTNLTALTSDLQKNQERIISSIERTSTAIGNISERVDQSTGTLGKIINDPKLYDPLAATSSSLDSIMLKMNNAEGSLGLMVNDSALYIEVTNLVTRVSNLITDIENNPKKYFKFSVF
jgi:phospholipid/cholesterol/gamma-HCH transport system substrate-binding protein